MQVDPVAFGHAKIEQSVGGPVDDPVELPVRIAVTHRVCTTDFHLIVQTWRRQGLLLRVLKDEERLVRKGPGLLLEDLPQCTLPNDGHGHGVLLQSAGMTGSTLIPSRERVCQDMSYPHRPFRR